MVLLLVLFTNLDWKTIVEAVKDFILPLSSLIFSTFAFYISFSERKNKKFNLKIDFLSEGEEWAVDRESDDEPDVYYENKYRLIESVVLTNNSSLPITITKFSITGIEEEITPFTRFGVDYAVTIISPKKRLPKGGIAYSGKELMKIADLTTFPPLSIPITIGPYESVVTSLIFRYNDPLVNSKIKINIHTSRGMKRVNRRVSSSHISQLVTDYVPPRSDEFL